MNQSELANRIHEIEKQLSTLPTGTVTIKKVNGKVYYYHRFTENKKRHEIYLHADEVDVLIKKTESRKKLELNCPSSKTAEIYAYRYQVV